MATQAHCAYCFETLTANFERRKPLGLAQVEELWARYHVDKSLELDDGGQNDADMTEDDADEEESSSARPAAISRLLNREPAQSAMSSDSSLPSTNTSSSTQSSKAASGAATPASSTSSRASLQEYPLFVTWNTVTRSGQKNLRGCIGTFEAQELEYGLRSYALTSALEDVRFSPIPSSLIPSLSVHVTLLTNFSTPSKEPLDWTLGKHGIRISFNHKGRRYGATYLPDVAPEQGWTKEETLISLMRKGGWNGSSSSWQKTWREGNGELITYEGKQVGLQYQEWREWRDWVDGQGANGKA
ncbi:related to ammecr1 protein [Ramularia collo-cygni]|uniref:Related to ammecr1 protein n=1 Tax=Ramularia collo-cygni TaxID=112498 RepID=A0A2D3VEI8_9PEZI|nr:related to ammecr1 protein [Ramularia collo-cygni]CZT20169.1 related to ammecr1 protein [Ramularia collo-cygni]